MARTAASAVVSEVARPTIAALLPSYRRSLLAENKAVKTVKAYMDAAILAERFLSSAGMPTAVSDVRREHLEAFVVKQLAENMPATASNRFRSLQQRGCLAGRGSASPQQSWGQALKVGPVDPA